MYCFNVNPTKEFKRKVLGVDGVDVIIYFCIKFRNKILINKFCFVKYVQKRGIKIFLYIF